jgi:hypothetical protein
MLVTFVDADHVKRTRGSGERGAGAAPVALKPKSVG